MLTPLDIESKTFSKSLTGYSVHQVRQFLKEVLASYEKLYKENIELKDKVNLLNEGIGYYKTIEDTLQNTLILAEKMAEETKANAKTKAEQIEKEAILNADGIINEAKNQVHTINQRKEELMRSYDAQRIQLKEFLKAQLALTEKNELVINTHTSDISDLFTHYDDTIEEAAYTEDVTTDEDEAEEY